MQIVKKHQHSPNNQSFPLILWQEADLQQCQNNFKWFYIFPYVLFTIVSFLVKPSEYFCFFTAFEHPMAPHTIQDNKTQIYNEISTESQITQVATNFMIHHQVLVYSE
jgi:hypothetical protein